MRYHSYDVYDADGSLTNVFTLAPLLPTGPVDPLVPSGPASPWDQQENAYSCDMYCLVTKSKDYILLLLFFKGASMHSSLPGSVKL